MGIGAVRGERHWKPRLVKLQLRLPEELHARLVVAAMVRRCSLNDEMLKRLGAELELPYWAEVRAVGRG